MEIDLVAVIVQAGALGLVVLLLLLAWKMGGPFLNRLMDNLDKMSQGYTDYVRVQMDVAATLRSLCQRMDESEDRDKAQDVLLAELVEGQREMTGVIRGVQQQLMSHEGRAQKRTDEQMRQSGERHQEQIEQGRELLKALQKLNGKS